VHFSEDAVPSRLAPAWIAPRVRLLETRLESLRERSVALEADRDARLRRELELRIQEERERARARALQIELAPGSMSR
jgi:hypothetical protein